MAGRAATDRVIRGRHAISVNDPGHPVPKGWQRVALGDVAELGTGHTPSRLHPEYWDGGIPWIGIRDAGAHHGGVIADTVQTVSDLGLENSAARLLPKDTVCLSRTASVGYVVKMAREMATSQDFVTWSCLDPLEADFLMGALLAEGQDIRRFGEGSTHTTIYFPEVKAFHIDLPPKAEQRRIVVKLDALTTRLARARAELNRVPVLAARIRNVAANAAFLAGERKSVTLADVLTDVRYGTSQKCSYVGGTPVLRIPNVKGGGIDLRDLKSADFDDREHIKLALELGDVLVIRSNGSIDLVGRAAVIEKHAVGMLYAGYLIRLRPDQSQVKPEYLNHFLSAPSTRAIIESAARSTSGVNNVNAQQLQNLRMPLPTVAEQTVITEQLNAAFARADRLETEATRARALLDRLEAAILARAFRGELVPQDPNDEPASVLLDRIRAERAAAPKPKRGRRAAADA